MKSSKGTQASITRFWATLIKYTVALVIFLFLYFFEVDELHPSKETLSGEPPKIYALASGDRLLDTLTASIGSAKNEIVLVIYTLRDWKIIKALNKQAEAGIKVRIICDSLASKGIERYLSPKIELFSRTSKGLMHLKLLIIDNTHTWIGSANFTKQALTHDANLMVHINHPTFTKLMLKKANQLIGSAFEMPIAPKTMSLNSQTIEFHFLPDNEKMHSRIESLIQTAKKSVKVAMYTFTRQDLAYALCKAQKRKVKVTVVFDNTSAKGASKKTLEFLKKENISVLTYDPHAMMHHKFILIDDSILLHGSANWTKAAFQQNDDCIMIMHDLDTPQKKALHEIWNSLIAHSIPS